MKNLDALKQEHQEIVQKMNDCIQKNDTEGFSQTFAELCQKIQEEVMAQAKELIQEQDVQILASRGVRQLTNSEREYYQKLTVAMKSDDPKQALANLDVVMPETIIDSVFEDLQTNHPLLSKINFTSVMGLTRMMMNTNGYQKAAWGKLGSEIVKELTSGFKEVDVTQEKLSAFLPVSKDMLDLGPVWIDAYVRQVLQEALSNGLEDGVINGTGKDMPIGMIKQVGDEVTVTGGVYPDKETIKITKMDNIQLGKLTAILAINEKGQSRRVLSLMMLVNPSDYFSKVLPAIQVLLPTGGYVTALPFEIDIIQSPAVPIGKAVYGMANRYFMGAGMGNNGRIGYSDEYRYLEDERVYLIKMYGHGFALDNNSFLYLDISGLQPAYYKVETINNTADVKNADLSDLKVGGLTISPKFSAETVAYTAETRNEGNTVIAIPADATAEISLEAGGKTMSNGSKITWETGENIVTVHVKDGSATKDYTVTVTNEEA